MEAKKVNLFLPIFIIGFVAGSILIQILVIKIENSGITLPIWMDYIYGEVIVLALVLLYLAVVRVNPVKSFSYGKLGIKDALLSLAAGYCMIPMVLFLSNLTMLFSKNYLNESTQELVSHIPFVVQVIIMAVIPPLVEEFAFRGLYFCSYRRTTGVLGSAIVSALLFGIFHLNLNQFAYAFALGIVFAYMVEATGSIWSSVLAHFAVNTYSITVIALLKLLGGVASKAVEDSSTQQTLADFPLPVIIVELAMLAGYAFGFTFLAFLCIKNMAKRHGNLDKIKLVRDGNEKHIITLPLVATVLMCIVYMIVIEIIN